MQKSVNHTSTLNSRALSFYEIDLSLVTLVFSESTEFIFPFDLVCFSYCAGAGTSAVRFKFFFINFTRNKETVNILQFNNYFDGMVAYFLKTARNNVDSLALEISCLCCKHTTSEFGGSYTIIQSKILLIRKGNS